MVVQRLERDGRVASARAQVHDVLRDAIVSLRLQPGERLSDLALAEQLGVSRTPVREALLQLADEALVRLVPQSGTFVAPISVPAVHEAQFVREAIEIAALQRATGRVTSAQIELLSEGVNAQRNAHAAGDRERFYALDEAFHRALLDATGLPTIWRVHDRTRAQLNRVRWLSLPDPRVLDALIAQHEAIVDAIAHGDLPRAEDTMRDHLRRVLHDLPRLMDAHPSFFTGP